MIRSKGSTNVRLSTLSSSSLMNNFFKLARLLFIDLDNECLLFCKLLLLVFKFSSFSYPAASFSAVPDQADKVAVLPRFFLPLTVLTAILESVVSLDFYHNQS